MSNLVTFNKTIQDTRTQAYLDSVLKDGKNEFVTSLVSVVSSNTLLQACEPLTIMYAAMKATTLKLPIDPNLGFAYVIPYKSKDGDQAQFQIGVKGLTQLAMRTGQFKTINTDIVYEGEFKGKNKISGEVDLTGEKKSEKVVGYFAYFKLINGFEKTIYMSREEVEKHAQRFSKAYNYGPWKTDFDAMAKKTVLKNLLSHYAPMSVEMASAVKADQAIFHDENLTPDYADNKETEQRDEMAEKVLAKRRRATEKVTEAMKPQVEEAVEVAPVEDDLPM